jgi:hypothetical protein
MVVNEIDGAKPAVMDPVSLVIPSSTLKGAVLLIILSIVYMVLISDQGWYHPPMAGVGDGIVVVRVGCVRQQKNEPRIGLVHVLN